MAARIAVIIVTYNGARWIAPCLASLARQTRPVDEIIVVDNASSDDTCAIIARDFPPVTLLRQTTNSGFSRGNNVGIRYALEHGHDAAILLNQDTEVTPDFIFSGMDFFDAHPAVGLASPVILYGDRSSVWFAGTEIYRGKRILTAPTVKIGIHLAKKQSWDQVRGRTLAHDWIPGCALFIRRSVVEKIGMFDETFFMYGEDMDFNFRAQRAGFELGVIPVAAVYHQEPLSWPFRINRRVLRKAINMMSARLRLLHRYFTVGERALYCVKCIFLPFMLLYARLAHLARR